MYAGVVATRTRGGRSYRTRAVAAIVCIHVGGSALEAADLSPKDAGARYGQAIGASLSCRGARLTPAAQRLEAAYAGAALEEFKSAAAKIAALWRTAMSCEKAREINACRLMMERNCAIAASEIGPRGAALPGLLHYPDKGDPAAQP